VFGGYVEEVKLQEENESKNSKAGKSSEKPHQGDTSSEAHQQLVTPAKIPNK